MNAVFLIFEIELKEFGVAFTVHLLVRNRVLGKEGRGADPVCLS